MKGYKVELSTNFVKILFLKGKKTWYDEKTGRVCLVIEDLGPGDEGDYQCRADNPYGDSTCTITVWECIIGLIPMGWFPDTILAEVDCSTCSTSNQIYIRNMFSLVCPMYLINPQMSYAFRLTQRLSARRRLFCLKEAAGWN